MDYNNYNENTNNNQNGEQQSSYSPNLYDPSQQNASQTSGSNPYQQTNGNYTNPYQQPQYQQFQNGGNRKPRKERGKGGMGAFLGKCAAGAAVFGVVAALVFTGVSYAGSRALGISSQSNNSSKTKIAANVSQTSTGNAQELNDVSAIAEEVMPSIVAITNVGTVTYQSFFGTQSYDSESAGSGIIISQDEKYLYIVTNNHVVSNASTLTVQFVDGSTVSAEVTGTDPSDDLAVVQVELDSIEKDTMDNIKVATVGDSESVIVGQATIAIGNALGYGQSVTTGIVSALGRTVSTQDETSGQTITNTNLIQTDAAINPGNSGGALLNASGEVIGINSVKYADTDVEGIGYAIPMADAIPIIEALINGDDLPQGAYLGIYGQPVSSDVASVYNMPEGVYIRQVIEGSAAEAAGLLQGDIITEFDGTTITSMTELQTLLAGYKEGDEVSLKISRMSDGSYSEKTVNVTLGATSSTTTTDMESDQDDESSNKKDGSKGRSSGDDDNEYDNEYDYDDLFDYFNSGR